MATFPLALVRASVRSWSRYGNRLIARQINGKARLYVWMSADESFRRALSHNLAKSV